MKRILDNPPFLEAFAEFYFASDNWDWTVAGSIYEKIKGDFKNREQFSATQFEMAAAPNGELQPTQRTVERIRFIRPDGSALVQIGPNFLAVNHLPPYQDWQDFKPLIEIILGHYLEIAQPTGLRQIGLRYINRIPFPKERTHFEDYLNTVPHIPNSKNQVWSSWTQNVEIIKEEIGSRLTVQAGTILDSPDDQGPSVMLDLWFACAHPDYLHINTISSWLDTAHKEIEDIFFESLTDQALEKFGIRHIEEMHD